MAKLIILNPITVTLYFTLFTSVVLNSHSASLHGKNTTSEEKGLYNVNDKIEILTSDSFQDRLQFKPYSLLIEFYSSWCGHCQRFAPVWKSFAKDIYPWRDVVVLGAIDCAQETNTPICREYEILAYPTVRFFHANFKAGENKIGEPTKVSHELKELRKTLVTRLISEQNEGKGTSWPNLSFQNPSNLRNVWQDVAYGVKYVMLFFENSTSTIGTELLLDIHNVNQINLKRINSESSVLVSALSISRVPSLVVVTKDFQTIPLTVVSNERDSIRHIIKIFAKSMNIEWPKDIEDLTTETSTMSQETDDNFQEIKDNLRLIGDAVFQSDLENALQYSLKHEIALKKTISGEELIALQKYLSLLSEYFPFGPNGRHFLRELRDRINEVDTEITGAEISNIVENLESNIGPIYTVPLKWIGCRGSVSSKRGYPCGLWTMFHYLTIAAANRGEVHTVGNKVLDVMYQYIKNYFGCGHCREHFQEMAVRKKYRDVRDSESAVLWLWEAHNEVNQRLSKDATEDPEFPKIQFPSPDRCPSCRHPNSEWDREEVLIYLRRVYGTPKDYLSARAAPAALVSSKSSWKVFSGYDALLTLMATLWQLQAAW